MEPRKIMINVDCFMHCLVEDIAEASTRAVSYCLLNSEFPTAESMVPWDGMDIVGGSYSDQIRWLTQSKSHIWSQTCSIVLSPGFIYYTVILLLTLDLIALKSRTIPGSLGMIQVRKHAPSKHPGLWRKLAYKPIQLVYLCISQSSYLVQLYLKRDLLIKVVQLKRLIYIIYIRISVDSYLTIKLYIILYHIHIYELPSLRGPF